MHELTGKNVLLTGASRGIGAAAAHEFVKVGARVMLVARDAWALKELTKELRAIPSTRAKVATMPGDAFGDHAKDFIRVSLTVDDKLLAESAERMLALA